MNFEWIRSIDENTKERFAKILPSEILNLFKIDDFFLVFYVWDNVKENPTRNVLKVDGNFNIIWQIEDHQWLVGVNEYKTYPYTGAAMKNGELEVRNYYGVNLKLDFETGKVTLIPGQRPW